MAKYRIVIGDLNNQDINAVDGPLSADVYSDCVDYSLSDSLPMDVIIQYGRGRLFMKDWSSADTMTRVYRWDDNTTQWLDIF